MVKVSVKVGVRVSVRLRVSLEIYQNSRYVIQIFLINLNYLVTDLDVISFLCFERYLEETRAVKILFFTDDGGEAVR